MKKNRYSLPGITVQRQERKHKKNKIQEWVIKNYSHLNDDEVDIFISSRTKDDFVELFEEYGMTKKEIKELLK